MASARRGQHRVKLGRSKQRPYRGISVLGGDNGLMYASAPRRRTMERALFLVVAATLALP
jgi:hypothetical protein